MTSGFQGSYEFGPFCLDVGERVLLQAGRVVPLRPKDFDLLLALIENSGRLLLKDELLQRVWSDSFVDEANLSHHVFTLRKVLGDATEASRYIETVPRRGYRFVASVARREKTRAGFLAAENGPVEPSDSGNRMADFAGGAVLCDASSGPASTRSRVTTQGRFLAVIAIAIVLIVAVYLWLQRGTIHERAHARHVIAVLPFKPVVPDQRDEALELGMADALIARLGSIRDITTRPIGAVRQYTSLEQDPIAAGKALGVAIVLDGSIQRAGERVRVRASLVRVKDGVSLWADQFDEQFTDIFAVQDAVSAQVVRSLALRLSADEQRQLTKRHTENAAAYELYLKGRFFWNKRTEDGMEKAIEYFRQAVAAAPDYALAYSGLADSYALLSNISAAAPKDAFPQARTAAERALALDDTLAEAHTSLAFVKEAFDWDWAGAEREYRRALDLDPNYASAHHRYGVFLCMMARCDQGLASLERARQLDPTSLIINADVGLGYYMARRYDDAISQLHRALELDPTSSRAHFYLVDCLVQKGRLEEAIAEAGRASELSRGRAVAAVAFSYAAVGRRAESREILEGLTVQAQESHVQPLGPAAAYTALGEHDAAFAWLERGVNQRAYTIVRVLTDPRFDPLRADARYLEFVRRLGFPQ